MENYSRYQSKIKTVVMEFSVLAANESAINSAYPVDNLELSRRDQKIESCRCDSVLSILI